MTQPCPAGLHDILFRLKEFEKTLISGGFDDFSEEARARTDPRAGAVSNPTLNLQWAKS